MTDRLSINAQIWLRGLRLGRVFGTSHSSIVTVDFPRCAGSRTLLMSIGLRLWLKRLAWQFVIYGSQPLFEFLVIVRRIEKCQETGGPS